MNWYVEEGIAEQRAVRLEGGEIAAARLHWPGSLIAGQVEDAKLVAREAGTQRGAALFANGERALVDKLPPPASEGATMRFEVTRARLSEGRREKIAQARLTDKPLQPVAGLAEQLRKEGHEVKVVRRFPADADWNELWAEANDQSISFAAGSLHFSPTPAMLLIDIDGEDHPASLAKAAIEPLASALRRFDLAGNIGIDFPTLADKGDRKAIDAALAGALADWPHERTAMNGFGFVQLVARLGRPSLINLVAGHPAQAKARLLLRQAEDIEEPGVLLLHCVDRVAKATEQEWLSELARRTGREVRLEVDSARADIDACFVQAVPR